MADTTIFGLTATTTAEAGDVFPVVDVSDTAQSAQGSTRKITYANILAGATSLPNLVTVQGFTVTLTGNLIRAGAHGIIMRTTATSDVTFPVSGTLYSSGTTDVAVADGGTGRSTSTTAYGLIAAGTTATGAHQTLAAGAATELLVGGGASALPVWTTASGTGAPLRGTGPTMSAPTISGLETHSGTDLYSAAAMGANAIDTTKARNTKTLSADTTFTYSATPSDGGEFGLELTGHTAVVTVTLPANTIDAAKMTTVTSFAMPASGVAFLQFRRVGSNYHVFGIPTPNILTFSSGNLATDDTYEGNVLAGLLAGATIAQWEAVYLGGSSTWLLADANGSGTFPCRGLAVAAYVSTNPAVVIDKGVVRNDAWAWTPGGDVYLSTTAGGLTQTAPSTSGDKIQKIGYALTADILYVNIGSGEYLTVT